MWFPCKSTLRMEIEYQYLPLPPSWNQMELLVTANLLSIGCPRLSWDAPNDPMRAACMAF